MTKGTVLCEVGGTAVIGLTPPGRRDVVEAAPWLLTEAREVRLSELELGDWGGWMEGTTAARDPMREAIGPGLLPKDSLFLLPRRFTCKAAASCSFLALFSKASLRALACSKTGLKWLWMSVGVMAACTLIL